MAKITLSPLVTDIRGKVGPVVFSKWKGQNTARALVRPGNPRTLGQRIARGFTYAVSKAWARQSDAYKAAFNLAASGQGYSGNNLFVRRMQEFNSRFRDFLTSAAGGSAAGQNILTVTASQPLDNPSYIDTLGFSEGARIEIAGHANSYFVTAVDHVANTLTLDRPLSAAVAGGEEVRIAGVMAPTNVPFTYRN